MAGLVVETNCGKVTGKRDGLSRCWLGIPYAKPPIGELRMRAPQPPSSWAGEYDATAFGPAAAQLTNLFRSEAALGAPPSDDCLYLNIWSPGVSAQLRPVMVWFHGGAFMFGSAAAYSGASMSTLADAVIVTVNYRLGVMGFSNLREALDLPQLASNAGLLDQIQSLRWVRDNIAAFGGDPNRVTIAGESAGSVSVALLTVCKAAHGLFHGAIMQSGSHSLVHSREKSLEMAGKLAAQLGLKRGNIGKLQSLPAALLIRAQTLVDKRMPNEIPAAPWWDDAHLPATLALATAIPSATIPLLIGSNRDEITLFRKTPGDILPTQRKDLARLTIAQLGETRANKILSAYPATQNGDTRLGGDLCFRMPTLQFAERHVLHAPAWTYRFDYGGPLFGPTHVVELAFLWDIEGFAMYLIRGGRLTGPRLALAQRMRAAWANFIASGDPGVQWPRYDLQRRRTMVFNLADEVVDDPDNAVRLAWGEDQVCVGA